jgi:DNA-binding response OmpR family regulator
MLIAQPAQAEAIRAPLADLLHLRLDVFATVDEALEAIRVRGPRVILADFERFGAAGIHGLAELMGTCNVPVILFVRDVSQWERDQFAVLGVQHVFGEHFRVAELAAQVEYAFRRRRRIGSSDRLPVVTA